MSTKTRIIIADPNEDFLSLLSDIIDQEEDIEVAACARDGMQALQLIGKHKPDMLLTELLLPRLDGLSLLRRLPETDASPRVIVHSPFWSEYNIRLCAELGAAQILCKPCSSLTLLEKIRQSDQPQSPCTPPPFRARDLESSVTLLLQEIGVPSHVKGYRYVREAVILAMADMGVTELVTKTLYPRIARAYNTTSSCVERAIRNAILLTWSRGNANALSQLFSIHHKPTSTEFIVSVAERLRMSC